MGSEFSKQPSKRLDREFRSMGATRVARSSLQVTYRFPDGSQRDIPSNISPRNAHNILTEVQERYGVSRGREKIDPLRSAIERPGAPVVDIARIVLSRHAGERFELMSAQANLDRLELADAIRYPERVLWSPLQGSWLWVRGRIIVALVVGDDERFIIRTIMWATEELWESNPRPTPEPV